MMKRLIKLIIVKLSWLINWLPFNNRFCLNGATLSIKDKILYRCRIYCKGHRNTIVCHSGGILRNCLLKIIGNDNIIEIGTNTSIVDGELWIEDNNNKICIGNNTMLTGEIHLACIEGCKITIGDNCLFSSDIVFRTGDSHSILDLNGNRINPSKDILIKDHVWIGNKVIITKGVTVSKDSGIGTGAIVTKSIFEQNVIIAGIPAKVVKQGTNWCSERI